MMCVCVCVCEFFVSVLLFFCFFLGIRYFPTAEHFPLDRLDLWSRDGVSRTISDKIANEKLTILKFS